jgi:Protein of unknown function (DUF2510)
MTEPTGESPAAAPLVSEPIADLAPGWYADPDDSSRQAYWNGTSWKRPKASTSTSRPTAASDAARSGGRPGWLLPVVGVVVVVLVVAVAAFLVTSKKSGSTSASGGDSGSSGAAAGPQATGPKVGANGVTVVLPDGWEQVPLDEVGFATALGKLTTDEPDLATTLKEQHSAAGDTLSLIALHKGSSGKYTTIATVTKQAPAGGDVAAFASKVEDTLGASVHDVSVTTGKVGDHDAVFATYDIVSALVPPQGAQVYILDPKGVAVVTVTSYDTYPLTLAKAFAPSVALS